MWFVDQARWYVYELVDGRDGSVFYVGKGCGNRMLAHENQAKSGVCSRKTSKIKEIWSCGSEILHRQVAFFWDEQAAYDHETDRIEAYGLANLTNILLGGQRAWEKRVLNLEQRRASARKPEPSNHPILEKKLSNYGIRLIWQHEYAS